MSNKPCILPLSCVTVLEDHGTHLEGLQVLEGKESRVLMTVHQFYGSQQEIVDHFSSLSFLPGFLPIQAFAFEETDHGDSVETHNVTLIYKHPSTPISDIFTAIKNKDTKVSLSQVVHVLHRLCSGIRILNEEKLFYGRCLRSTLVTKSWELIFLPPLNRIDRRTIQTTKRSTKYLAFLLSNEETHKLPSWIEYEDIYSFVTMLRELIECCKPKFTAGKPAKYKNVELLPQSCSFLQFNEEEGDFPTWELICKDITKAMAEVTLLHSKTVKFWLQYFQFDVQVDIQSLVDKIFTYSDEVFSRESKNYRAVVAIICNLKQQPTSKGTMVTMNDLYIVLEYFGPISAEFIESVTMLAKNRWFHGLITKSDTDGLKEAPYGTFLVRFSSRVGSYAISKSPREKGGSVLNFLIEHTFNSRFVFGSKSYVDLDQIIFSRKSDLALQQPLPGSPFQEIFLGGNSASRYCEEFSDDEFSDEEF